MPVYEAIWWVISTLFGAGGLIALGYGVSICRQHATRVASIEQAFPGWQAAMEGVRGECHSILDQAEQERKRAATIRQTATQRLHEAGLTSTGAPANGEDAAPPGSGQQGDSSW